MQSLRRLTSAVAAGLLLLGAIATPSPVAAKPAPGTPSRGFRLFARSLGALTINRVLCGLTSNGNICTDSTNSSTIGGGFWPKGTADQYVFNSGLQLAGIIQGTKPANPWGGDISGAFFFNARGGGNGEEVQPIYNSTSAADVASWPDAAKVPTELVDANNLFNPLLRGRVNASQGDVWWLDWDGNPDLNASRNHPLGVVVEQRGMGWNFPAGNEDIIYFIYTFYNVTSTNAADYANVRPEMQPILLTKAAEFQKRNNAKFGITLPAGGYTIDPLYAAFGADMDVASADANYSSVNLPFALGYAYERTFTQSPGWTFDPKIFSGNFFAGNGFVGVKYLRSPTGPGAIQLFSNTQNNRPGAVFFDPNSIQQLYRYLSGTLIASDGTCSNGPAATTHICFIGQAATDTRFFQSSTALTLPPGGFGSIVVAYIFAPPTRVASFTPSPSADIKPGNPNILTSVSGMASGVNMIDSLTGFKKFVDINGNGIPEQDEFTVVPGSLLGKAKTAQAVFNNGFLLPFAPESPDFFLIPGDNQVAVIWRPSASETTGDPFFGVASQPTILDATGATVANPLYDPNYRQFDVEGYRIYRGRVDSPNSLTLLKQFDYGGTTIKDFAGQINPNIQCAPELGITTSCATTFDAPFPTPGTVTQARTKFVEIPLVGEIVQVQLGGRTTLADGTAIVTGADTAVTGLASGFPQLEDNGVPFTYVDHNVRNNFRYFYAVTAFDINSFQSGPSNLESARITKSVTPMKAASNAVSTATPTITVLDRKGTALTVGAAPTLDATTGLFSGPQPPADGATVGFATTVSQVLGAPVSFTATLDSIALGSSYDGAPATYYWTGKSQFGSFQISTDVAQDPFDGTSTGATNPKFPAAKSDAVQAAKFGGDGNFPLTGEVNMTMPGSYFSTGFGRGAAFGPETSGIAAFLNASYQGVRFFTGANEAGTNPAENNVANGGHFTSFNNSSEIAGVTIFEPHGYVGFAGTGYRSVDGILSGAARAADFKIYWGAAGKIDSVIDVTHNVPVPFSDSEGGTWGILNASAQIGGDSRDSSSVLTVADLSCVAPLRFFYTGVLRCRIGAVPPSAANPAGIPASGPVDPYLLSNTAQLGTIAFFDTDSSAAKVAAKAANPANQGFGLYLPGHHFLVQTAALPASGTVWTARSYVGLVSGGKANGPYKFTPTTRPFTAVGASLAVSYTAQNTLAAAADSDLTRVHTVPDPYYVTNEFESTTDTKIIKFVNLPAQCIIRIYSSSGVLVSLLEHNSSTAGNSETWNVRNRNNQVVASGVYFYHVEAGDARKVGRFTVVNFAQ